MPMSCGLCSPHSRRWIPPSPCNEGGGLIKSNIHVDSFIFIFYDKVTHVIH